MRKRLLALSLAELRQNALKTCDLYIYGDIQIITNRFSKILLKIATPYPTLWIVFFNKYILFLSVYFTAHDVQENTEKIIYIYIYIYIYIRILTHSSRVLNFILPGCKSSINEVVRNTLLVEHACSRAKFLAICVQHHHLGPSLVMCATCHPPWFCS